MKRYIVALGLLTACAKPHAEECKPESLIAIQLVDDQLAVQKQLDECKQTLEFERRPTGSLDTAADIERYAPKKAVPPVSQQVTKP
jgi:hypothetical protein